MGNNIKEVLYFQRMLTDHPNFIQTVTNSWGDIYLVLLAIFYMLSFNASAKHSGNGIGTLSVTLLTKSESSPNAFYTLEQHLHSSWDPDIHIEWENCKKELLQIEAWDNERLCTQARLDWTKYWDRNSRFCHAVIKERRQKQLIQIRTSQ